MLILFIIFMTYITGWRESPDSGIWAWVAAFDVANFLVGFAAHSFFSKRQG